MLIAELAKHGSVYIDSKNVPKKFLHQLLSIPNVIDATKTYGISLKGFHFYRALHFIEQEKITHFVISPGPKGSNDYFNLRESIIIYIFKWLYRHNVRNYIIGSEFFGSTIWGKYMVKQLYKHSIVFLRNKKDCEKYTGSHYLPDLALSYKPQGTHIGHECWISLRLLHKENSLDYFQEIKPIVDYCSKHRIPIVLFYQVAVDKELNYNLYQQISAIYPNTKFRTQKLEYDTIPEYNNARYVVSNRLHVVLLAYLHGCIPLALLSKDSRISKIEKILQSLGLSELVLRSSDIEQQIDTIDKSDIFKQIPQFKIEIQSQISSIFNG